MNKTYTDELFAHYLESDHQLPVEMELTALSDQVEQQETISSEDLEKVAVLAQKAGFYAGLRTAFRIFQELKLDD